MYNWGWFLGKHNKVVTFYPDIIVIYAKIVGF